MSKYKYPSSPAKGHSVLAALNPCSSVEEMKRWYLEQDAGLNGGQLLDRVIMAHVSFHTGRQAA